MATKTKGNNCIMLREKGKLLTLTQSELKSKMMKLSPCIKVNYQQYVRLRKAKLLLDSLRCCGDVAPSKNQAVGSWNVADEQEKDLALFPNPGEINKFVPQCDPAREEDVKRLQEFVNCSKRLLVLTGAGMSTESGIPDYRSEGVGLYATSTNRPVQYHDFVKKAEIRRRYWARNYVGWPKFGYFHPNISHITLANWEKHGKVHWLITQNVDALHYKAGSKNITELHGSAHRVMCLNCDHTMSRPDMQVLIESYNPNWSAQSDEMAPDADVQLTPEQIEGFNVPPCPSCGGNLKPEITFFGDNVAKHVVDFVRQKVDECDSVLFAGTSLQVYSGYRFAATAQDKNKPIAILNIGPTRADKIAQLKINAKCGDVLPKIKLWR
ncbi:NAD-dependent protein lipoamidase sirtuin-4 [Mactra antiquata]